MSEQILIVDNETYVFELVAPTNAGGSTEARFVSIQDAGDYYTSEDVEGALQEVGATNDSQDTSIATNASDITALETTVSNIGLQEVMNVDPIMTDTVSAITIRGNSIVLSNATGTASVSVSNNFSVGGPNATATLGSFAITQQLQNNAFYSPYALIASSAGVAEINPTLTGKQTSYIELTEDTQFTINNPSTSLYEEATTIILYTLQDNTGGWAVTFDSTYFGEVESSQVTTSAGELTLYVLVKSPDNSGLGFDGKYRGSGKTFAS